MAYSLGMEKTFKKMGRPTNTTEVCLIGRFSLPSASDSGVACRYYSPDDSRHYFGDVFGGLAVKMFKNERQAKCAFRGQRLAQALGVAPAVGRMVKVSTRTLHWWGYETAVADGRLLVDSAREDKDNWPCRDALRNTLRGIGFGSDLHSKNIWLRSDRTMLAIDFSFHSCDQYAKRGYPVGFEKTLLAAELRLCVGSPQRDFVGPILPENELVPA